MQMLADADASSLTDIFVRGGVLIGLLLAGFLVVVLFRRWLSAPIQTDDSGGFTLGDLRKMLERGEITAEEFEKTRAKIIEAAQRTATRKAQEGPASNSQKPPVRKDPPTLPGQ